MAHRVPNFTGSRSEHADRATLSQQFNGSRQLPRAGSSALVLTGIFRTLISEHRDLLGVLTRLANTSDPSLRSELFPQLREQLVSHERGEMSVLYPSLRAHGLTYGVAERHDTSARKLEVVVGCLSGYSFDNPEWAETTQTLLQIVQEHVDEEEHQFFALAQEALGRKRTEDLDERYRARRVS